MTAIDEAKESLTRVQDFNTSDLPRREELGTKFAFDEAVDPAKRLISLFKKLPAETLSEFPDQQLASIKKSADQVFNLFEQVLQFDATQAEATTRKQQIIDNITNQYQSVFSTLFPFISYSVARTVDFSRLESEGRAAVPKH